MLDRNIEKEIKCYYFDKCTQADVWSKSSKCPDCKHNKWENPKKDYYQPKTEAIEVIVAIVIFIGCCLLMFA